MIKPLQCTATKMEIVNDTGSVIFKCPRCAQADILRSYHCREIGTRYTCSQCGFEGPN